MPNYGPVNGQFLNDYSGVNSAASATKGFIEGWQNAEDRQMKRQEFEAKQRAMQTQAEREAAQMQLDKQKSALEARKQGIVFNDQGQMGPAQLTPKEQSDENLKAFGEGARIKGYDQYGNPNGYELDPNTPKAIQAKNAGIKNERNMELQDERLGLQRERMGLQRERFGETTNVNASKAGTAFENNHLLNQMKTTLNNLDRAKGMLDGKVPLTAQNFNLLQNDLISATAPGGAATEGKISREMVDTYAQRLNELKTKFGTISDIRKAQPQLVNQLRDLINEIDGEYRHGVSRQAADIHDSFATNTNPKVREIVKQKLQRYAPEEYAKRYGSEEDGGQGGGGLVKPGLVAQPQGLVNAPLTQSAMPDDPDALKYSQMHGLDYATAKAILDKRRAQGGQ